MAVASEAAAGAGAGVGVAAGAGAAVGAAFGGGVRRREESRARGFTDVSTGARPDIASVGAGAGGGGATATGGGGAGSGAGASRTGSGSGVGSGRGVASSRRSRMSIRSGSSTTSRLRSSSVVRSEVVGSARSKYSMAGFSTITSSSCSSSAFLRFLYSRLPIAWPPLPLPRRPLLARAHPLHVGGFRWPRGYRRHDAQNWSPHSSQISSALSSASFSQRPFNAFRPSRLRLQSTSSGAVLRVWAARPTSEEPS